MNKQQIQFRNGHSTSTDLSQKKPLSLTNTYILNKVTQCYSDLFALTCTHILVFPGFFFFSHWLPQMLITPTWALNTGICYEYGIWHAKRLYHLSNVLQLKVTVQHTNMCYDLNKVSDTTILQLKLKSSELALLTLLLTQ